MLVTVRRPPELSLGAALPGTTRDRGQILVLFVLFVVVLIGFAAVAVDLGSYLKVRRDYQNAADAEALAGSPFLVGSSPDRTSARHAAWDSLANQLNVTFPGTPWTSDTPAGTPVTDSTGTYSIWVSTPPINAGAKYPGTYTGANDKSIFVYVQAQSPSYFSHVFGINGSLVSAWATAGNYPNQYAVITLRQPGQAGPAQPNINLAGTNVTLTVIGGDVGGNYNMKLNSNTNLVLPGDSNVYLHDYVSCGQSCWGNTQINNGSTPLVLKTAKQLPGPIPDPNYPLPTSTTGGPTSPVTTGTSILPYGYTNDFPSADKKSSNGAVLVGSGGDSPAAHSVTTDAAGVQHCDGANAVRIGPGFYTRLSVQGPYCVILDPTAKHDCISNGSGCTDHPTAIPQDQMPGVFYFGGTNAGSGISIGNGAMVVGDGVTIVMRPTGGPSDKDPLTISGGVGGPAIMDLNRGQSPLVSVAEASGAWTRLGAQPYVWSGSSWTYTNTYESDPAQTGIALYVMRRDQLGLIGIAADDNTNVVSAGGGNSALSWTGVTYAPHDNVTLAGQPGHDGIGQLVSWTFTFNGGSNVTQTYTGPVVGIPLLLEPYVGEQ